MWKGISILWLLTLSTQTHVHCVKANRQFSEPIKVQYLERTSGYYQLPDTQLNTQNQILLDTLTPFVQQMEDNKGALNQAKLTLMEAQTALKTLGKAISSYEERSGSTLIILAQLGSSGNPNNIDLTEMKSRVKGIDEVFVTENVLSTYLEYEETVKDLENQLANVMIDNLDQISSIEKTLLSIISSANNLTPRVQKFESEVSIILDEILKSRLVVSRKNCRLNNFRREEILKYLVSYWANGATVPQQAKYSMPGTFLPVLLRNNGQFIHQSPSIMQPYKGFINKQNMHLNSVLDSEIQKSRYNREIFLLENLLDKLSFLKNLLNGLLIREQNESFPLKTQNLLQEIGISENELLQHIEIYKQLYRYRNMGHISSAIQDQYKEKVDNILRNTVDHLALKEE